MTAWISPPASETVDLDGIGVGNVGRVAEHLTTAAVLDFRGLHGCWRLRYEQLEIEMMKDSKAEHKQHRSNLQIGKTCGCNCGKRNFQRGKELTRLRLFLVGTIDGPQTLSSLPASNR